MTENEWSLIAKKAFPHQAIKAPVFLWTRILAGIEAVEAERAVTWWMQSRWMSQVTVVIALMIGLGAYVLLQNEVMPLDAALDGRSSQLQSLQLASMDSAYIDDTAVLVVGLDS